MAFSRLRVAGFVTAGPDDLFLMPPERVLLQGVQSLPSVLGPEGLGGLEGLVAPGGRLVVEGSSDAVVEVLSGAGFLHRDLACVSVEAVRRVAAMFSASPVPDGVAREVLGWVPGLQASWLALVGWGVAPDDAALLVPPAPLPEVPWGLWGVLDGVSGDPAGLAHVAGRLSAAQLSDLLLWLSGRDMVDAEVLAACWRLARSCVPSAVVLLVSSAFRASW